MIKDSALILIVADIKLFGIFEPGPHAGFGGDVFVHHGDVGRDAGVQPADNFVKNCLLLTRRLSLVRLCHVETVLLVYQFPYGFAVVVGIGLYV